MILLATLLALASSGSPEDRTALALERCLASPKGARAAPAREIDPNEAQDQVDEPSETPASDGRGICLDNAVRSYDSRIVRTYKALLKRSDPALAEWLSRTNQAWLEYRGTATDETDRVTIARDHALWLEGLRR